MNTICCHREIWPHSYPQTLQKYCPLKSQLCFISDLLYTLFRHHHWKNWWGTPVSVQLLYNYFLPFFFLNELCTRYAIRDFSNWCGMEVYDAQKSYVCMDVVVQRSSWSSDDNRHVGIFRIHVLFTPLRLVWVAQYLTSQSLTVDSNFVRRPPQIFSDTQSYQSWHGSSKDMVIFMYFAENVELRISRLRRHLKLYYNTTNQLLRYLLL